jgi:hypothetical protein
MVVWQHRQQQQQLVAVAVPWEAADRRRPQTEMHRPVEEAVEPLQQAAQAMQAAPVAVEVLLEAAVPCQQELVEEVPVKLQQQSQLMTTLT